jgi:hypothetical protein
MAKPTKKSSKLNTPSVTVIIAVAAFLLAGVHGRQSVGSIELAE